MSAIAIHAYHAVLAIRHLYWVTLYGSILFFGLEYLWPRSKSPLELQRRAIPFWIANMAVLAAATSLVNSGITALHLSPLISRDLITHARFSNPVLRIGALIAVSVLAIIVGDFFYYWSHRATHISATLWRLHRPHHAIRELSAVNSAAHIGDLLLTVPFVAVPIRLLLPPAAEFTPAVIVILIGIHGFLNHSCTAVHLGPLRYLFSDNRFHRIHHSPEQRHHNRNFGNLTTVWDQVFGTAYFPNTGEWPATGLANFQASENFWKHLLEPFRKTVPQLLSSSEGFATAIGRRLPSEEIR